MDRRALVARLLHDRGDLMVVTGLGSATYDVAACGDHPLNFYIWGGLGCTPSVGADQHFISLGTLTGPVLNIDTLPYTVMSFNSTVTAVRLGHITFGGQVFTIKQTSW